MAQVNGHGGEVKPRWQRRPRIPRRHDLSSEEWLCRTREGRRAAAQLRIWDRPPQYRPAVLRRERWRPEGRGTCPACRRGNFTNSPNHCGRRDCAGYIDTWLGDQRIRLFENLLLYDGAVAMTTITAPSLPWDTDHCAPLGEHKCSGRLGCRVPPDLATRFNKSASRRFSQLHKAAYQATYRRYGAGALQRLAYAPELQLRGVVHWHVAVGVGSPHQAAAARYYVKQLHEHAPTYGYGFVDRKLEPAPAAKAAYYLSKYMATVKNAKGGLRELILRNEAPERPVGIRPSLTKESRCTMRNLRRRRALYLRFYRRFTMHEVEAIWKILDVFPGATLREDAAVEPSASP